MTLINSLTICVGLALFCLQLICQHTNAELINSAHLAATPIDSLYDNLLQREYAGPVVFPNHQVERKAQRSPSLRLRFGRSDPDILNAIMQKRWFGDVNQKPIRSPSLRLRFGRRSDPNMSPRSGFDDLLEHELALSVDNANDYNEAALYDAYERAVRKPQRLRWGRSVPYESTVTVVAAANENNDNDNDDDDDDNDYTAAVYNALMNSNNLRNILLALRQNDLTHQAGEYMAAEEDSTEFQREARKPGPLRLRWGRSTGVAPTEKKQEAVQSINAAPAAVGKAQN